MPNVPMIPVDRVSPVLHKKLGRFRAVGKSCGASFAFPPVPRTIAQINTS